MPGYLVHSNATVLCAHAPGKAQPMMTYPRVKIGGQDVVTQNITYAVSNCALTGTSNPPCASATWTSAATKVRAGGQPVLLQDSSSTCTPTGTPLNVAVTQTRVKGI